MKRSFKLFLISIVLFFLLFINVSTCKKNSKVGCYRAPNGKIPQLIKSPLPWTYIKPEDIPKNFDWRNVNGKCLVTPIGNQFSPKFCGSCWAFSATRSVSDRMKIHYNASRPDVVLSVQALLDCGNDLNGAGGCNGGSFELAWDLMSQFGITDETCSPYMAVDYWGNSELPCYETMCRACDRFGTCGPVLNATRYYVSEYGTIPAYDINAMMAEIYARGPIACGMYAHSDDFSNYKGGIINNTQKYSEITHIINLVGFGEENGIKYWIGRNSFGTFWGEEGWFRIVRGINSLLIESNCGWALPQF